MPVRVSAGPHHAGRRFLLLVAGVRPQPARLRAHPPATAEFGHVTPGGPAHEYPPDGPMRVVKLSVGSYDNNVYLIASEDEGVIVDGAADADRILPEVERLGVRVVAILQTHNHFD